MNAVPAKVAGCRRIAMVVPTPDGAVNPLVLAAARIAGVDEIYRVGGAQAIAALAYGTETIAPVAKIVGPGNAYVAAAKRRVFGVVGIDMIAGPSEVVVLADRERRSALRRRRPARRRPSTTRRRSRSSSPTIAALARAVVGEGRAPARRCCRGQRSPARAGATTARSSSPRRSRRRRRSSTGSRPSISRSSPATPRRSPTDRQRRRDLPWVQYARGDRRLCRRLQSCAADCALGALLLGPRRARLHEAHLDPQMRRPIARRARARGDHARRGRVARRPRALGRAAPRPANGRRMQAA